MVLGVEPLKHLGEGWGNRWREGEGSGLRASGVPCPLRSAPNPNLRLTTLAGSGEAHRARGRPDLGVEPLEPLHGALPLRGTREMWGDAREMASYLQALRGARRGPVLGLGLAFGFGCGFGLGPSPALPCGGF